MDDDELDELSSDFKLVKKLKKGKVRLQNINVLNIYCLPYIYVKYSATCPNGRLTNADTCPLRTLNLSLLLFTMLSNGCPFLLKRTLG